MKQATQKRRKVNWQDKLPILKQGIAEGKTAAQIAAEIGCGISAVHMARYEYLPQRKPQRQWTAKEVKELLTMFEQSKPRWFMAENLNRTEGSVGSMLERLAAQR